MNKVLKNHREDLASTRVLITRLISRLEKVVDEYEYSDERPPEWKYIWGEKENAVSALTKLTGLLVKIIPMVQDLLEAKGEKKEEVKAEKPVSEEDRAIIDRFLERRGG